ncbi:MAG: ATP-binding protein [Planctomycetota bacterium]|nr:ATP-binding protein [Planctomycetota bacterium]MDA1106134.1 ATP-binding protein [Planctomycetota bacterium]
MKVARSIWMVSGNACLVMGAGVLAAASGIGGPWLPASPGVPPTGWVGVAAAGALLASLALLLPHRRMGRGLSLHGVLTVGLAALMVAALLWVPALVPGAALSAALLATIAWRDDGHWSTATLGAALVGIGLVRLVTGSVLHESDGLLHTIASIPDWLGLLGLLIGLTGLARAVTQARHWRWGPAWLPLPVFVILAAISSSVSLNLRVAGEVEVSERARSQATLVKHLLEQQWRSREESLARMATLIAGEEADSTDVPEIAGLYFGDLPELVSMVLYDEEGEPLRELRGSHVGGPRLNRGLVRSLLMEVRLRGLPVAQLALHGDPAKLVAVVALPVESRPGLHSDRAAVALLDLATFCASAIPQDTTRFGIRQGVFVGNDTLLGGAPAPIAMGAGGTAPQKGVPSMHANVGGELLTVWAEPDSTEVDRHLGRYPRAMLTALLAVAGLLAASTALVQQSLRRTDAAVRNRQRTERLIEAAPMVAVMVTDASGVFTRFNEAAHHITGFLANEQIGARTLASLLTNAELDRLGVQRPDAEASALLARQVMEEGWLRGRDRRPMRAWGIRCRDGSERQLLLAATEWTDEDDQPGHLLVGVDVTDEKASMAALERARARAVDANARKSQLLADVSHDVKNPLQSVKGFAELLEDPRIGESERADYVARIIQWSDYIDRVVKAIIDEHQVEAGQMSVERIETHPAKLVREVARLLEPEAKRKGLAFTCVVAGAADAICLSDPTRLEQIILNLVANAVKFTESGSVSIQFSATEERGTLSFTVEVRDTGIGISPDGLSRLFQTYGQADPSIHRRFGGSGRGLRISRGLAARLGGTITAQSEPGVGSTFTLRCRAAMVSPATPELPESSKDRREKRASSKQGLDGLRILLAEDGPDLRRLFERYMHKACATASLVPDGIAAVEAEREARVAGTPFDLVVLDLDMPRMSGADAARTMRDSGCSSPMIALTGVTSSTLDQQALGDSFDEVISKPIGMDRFIEVCAKFARRGPTPS